MVIGSSINSGAGAVAGRDCGVLSASENGLRVVSFPSDQGAEARKRAFLRPRLTVNRFDVNDSSKK